MGNGGSAYQPVRRKLGLDMGQFRPSVSDREVPRAAKPVFQHLLYTYASETNKPAAVWSELTDQHLEFRPHPRSSSVRQILVHQILSERRFFAEFIGLREPEVDGLLPGGETPPLE